MRKSPLLEVWLLGLRGSRELVAVHSLGSHRESHHSAALQGGLSLQGRKALTSQDPSHHPWGDATPLSIP